MRSTSETIVMRTYAGAVKGPSDRARSGKIGRESREAIDCCPHRSKRPRRRLPWGLFHVRVDLLCALPGSRSDQASDRDWEQCCQDGTGEKYGGQSRQHWFARFKLCSGFLSSVQLCEQLQGLHWSCDIQSCRNFTRSRFLIA